MNGEQPIREVKVFLKDSAFALLMNVDFLASWNILVRSNTLKTSVFQRPEFVCGWYGAKKNEFSPMIISEHQGADLTALICLAVPAETEKPSKAQVKIVGAGEYDAEYQGWLCSHDRPLDFLETALTQLFELFPKAQLSLRFFLDHQLVSAIRQHKRLHKWVSIQSFSRPIAALQEPEFDKILRKRHLKAKINRFNRAGNAELEIVNTKERLVQVLPQIMLLYDFRQGALFNKFPSNKFLNETPLFVALLDSGIIHISILKLDNEITSCIVCYHCDRWMHLAGMITYSPFFAKWSPGLVHIYMLGELFREEGFEFFDLTPGYDGYKEKFASTSDTVFELTFSQRALPRLTKKAKIAFQTYLVKRGIRPMTFDLNVRKKKYFVQKKIKGVLEKTKILLTPMKRFDSLASVDLKKNSIQDLLCFIEEDMLSKWEFLEDAFLKTEGGGQFVTVSNDGRLIACIWFLQRKEIDSANIEKHSAIENLTPSFDDSYFSQTVSIHKRELFQKCVSWWNQSS